MNFIKAKEEGFTLLESMLILLITASLILIPTLSIDRMVETVQVDMFFRELSSNITLMQNYSILHGEKTEVRFRPYESGHRIDFLVNFDASSPLNKTIYLDESLYYFTEKSGSEMIFNGDTGNISGGGTVFFNTVKGEYKLSYWLGSGRFAIDKIENN
jgi:competence protein ComGD